MNIRCLWTAIAVLLASLILWGCETTETVYVTHPDSDPPGVPRGVASITGDEEVTIVWLGSTETDLRGYIVYRDDDGDELYDEIGRLIIDEYRPQWTFVDRDVVNSHTYLYAVSAFDYDANESDLSYEDVFDTPRPAGFNVFVDALSNTSGFDFSARNKVSRTSSSADVIFTFDADLATLFIEAANEDVDIQDFGFTASIDDLDWAPEQGWSSVGWAELILGHTYVIWTADNRFAKIRVTELGATALRFDWAHQEDFGNPELKRVPDSTRTQSNPSGRRNAGGTGL